MRRKRRSYYARRKTSMLVFSLVCVLLIMIGAHVQRSVYAVTFEKTNQEAPGAYWSQLWPHWRDILFYGIPGLTAVKEKETSVKVSGTSTTQYLLRGAVLFFTGIDIQDIHSFLYSELPLTAAFKSGKPTVNVNNIPNFPQFEPQTQKFLADGKPLVGIYHTHTSESYIPSSGVDHAPGGQRGDIVNVGAELVKALEENGIKAVQSTAINDYPSFMKAYDKSEITAKKMLADYPSLQMIFDIHRDADQRKNVIAVVNGITVARITIVVATGHQELVQPHWKQNYAFAKLIDAKLNEKFPGLSRGIQMVDWRYNQHLHPRALLLEVGSQETSTEEACQSMKMLAVVLKEIITENK
ncbi:spore ii p: stage ii sporulation protein p [Lucifera butyrica]|uniref:Spore ii p: stage ii sporulation protein p n=1 Tax=Lucifera butyrica TaxID=1351585 RepID=A0A498R4R2_9FIRM|nr:stage II sporulation protein P [Lucifera butyrica]VBB06105.1 spore ii p: stage ii sporulation protein p [Lucifera butyrica]